MVRTRRRGSRVPLAEFRKKEGQESDFPELFQGSVKKYAGRDAVVAVAVVEEMKKYSVAIEIPIKSFLEALFPNSSGGNASFRRKSKSLAPKDGEILSHELLLGFVFDNLVHNLHMFNLHCEGKRSFTGDTPPRNDEIEDRATNGDREETESSLPQNLANGLLYIPLSNAEHLKSTLSSVSLTEFIEFIAQLGKSSTDHPDKKKLFSFQDFFRYTEAGDTEGSISYSHFHNSMLLLPSERLEDDPRTFLPVDTASPGIVKVCKYQVLDFTYTEA
ncbi:hypothetical protein COCNU_12G006720 [Cocos nucifera]|uniref:Uncharacterized protein n=1 Tax=Cocos nucifera TaxID=13894 RepID=A0A8K0NAM1_COCNU|nr:hypothetical protein COCNU_12G006720 [Cocos nucifera]